ncbi:MAG: hypothetical protein IH988_00475 [Planctomycetes bacterium]|nr:hypothetical protein [Planctomycetota bacterium]
MEHDSHFRAGVVRRLQHVRTALRTLLVLDGASRLVICCLLFASAQLALDWLIRWSWELRASILAAAGVGFSAGMWRWVLAPLRIPLALSTVAGLVERRHPKLNCLLVSAVQFDHGGVGSAESNSPGLVRSALDQARSACSPIDFREVLNRPAQRRAMVVLACCVGAFTAAFAVQPEVMGVWLDRNVLLGTATWPKRTQLIVDLPGGVLHGARGDDLTFSASVVGDVPRQVDVVLSDSDGSPVRRAMVRVGERDFRHIFEAVESDFEFYLEGGDHRTDTWRTQLVDRPRIERAGVTVTPPAYSNIEPFTLPEGRLSVSVLRGSELLLDFDTNKRLRDAVLTSEGQAVAEVIVQQLHGRARWVPKKSAIATLTLTDENGLENRDSPVFAVRLTDDQAPVASLTISGVGELVTPQARLPLDIRFEDDYGLAEAELIYTIWGTQEGEQRRAVPGFLPAMKRHTAQWEVPVASFGVSAGAGLTLMTRAVDFDDLQGPNVGTSTSISLRIVETEELLAELARREQEARRTLEQTIDRQEQLRRDLLDSLHDAESDDTRDESFRRAWANFPSQQEQIATRVRAVQGQVERILSEMHYNDLLTPATEQRLRDGVARRLATLTERRLVASTEILRGVARNRSLAEAGRIDPTQAEILAVMQSVLADMLKWEGLQQAMGLLRDIIRLQQELNEATNAEQEHRAEQIFGSERAETIED